MTIEIQHQARVTPVRPGDVPADAAVVDPATLTDADGMTYTGPLPVLDADGWPTKVYRPDYPAGMAPWQRHPECPTCRAMRDPARRFGPSHEIRDRCESGKRPHCSCPTCWG